MKKLGSYFVMLSVAILALFATSCTKSDDDQEEPLEPFIKYAIPKTFYETYTAYKGEKALIDYRPASEFAKGSLPGAVNIPATIFNTTSNEDTWCVALLNAYPDKNTCLFLFGEKSFQMSTTVGGRASKLGYGKQNTRVSDEGYSKLVLIWGK